MALFAVNRYLGVEESEKKTAADQSGLILQKLKKDAEKRKQERRKKNDKTLTKVQQKEEKAQTDESKETDMPKGDDRVKEKSPRKRKRRIDEEILNVPSAGKLQRRTKDKSVKSDTSKSVRSEDNNIESGDSDSNVDSSLSSLKTDDKETKTLSDSITKRLKNDISMAADVSDENSDVENRLTEIQEEDKTGSHEVGGYTVLGDFKPKQVEKVKRVLPDWLAKPSVVSADISHDQTPISDIIGLHQHIVDKLTENGISTFFPVQTQIIPAMLSSVRAGYHIGPAGYRPSDICCSAPTGSGKTLAFVIPIIQALMDRVVCQIRALVVLPVQDLARQVFGVFQTYCKGTNIKVSLIIGQKTFQSEQQSLVKKRCRGYHSQVDIVVATPGRLVDHINKTHGFDLRHLRFLVIDEADRMMGEFKQDWLSQVEQAVYTTKYGHGLYPEYTRPQPEHITVASAAKLEMPLQKLLFSATLSQNPEKLQQLKLFQPRLFTSVVSGITTSTPVKLGTNSNRDASTDKVADAQETEDSARAEFIGKYTTPVGLTEYFVESFPSEKPLMVLHFIRNLGYRQVLCFTNSVEATHRLCLLAKLAGGIQVQEFSSSLHATKRRRILQQFKLGKIDLLTCSDAMARGMDVENVKYVISYDSAPFIKTYIHRVGRTARAGKPGTAVTLLQRKEVFHFKKTLKEAGKTNIKEMKVSKSDLLPIVHDYQEALKKLPDVLKQERRKTI